MEIIPKVLSALGLVALCAIGIAVTIIQLQQKHIDRKRQNFKPSVIKNGTMFYVRYMPSAVTPDEVLEGFPIFSEYQAEAQVFEEYDLAVTILELVRKTNPKSELVEV